MMDEYDRGLIILALAITIILGSFVIALHVKSGEIKNDLELEQNRLQLLDESYFMLTTQKGVTNPDSEISCKLRGTYLQKYQHDWTNMTMKNIAYDMWINDCLTVGIEK